MIEIGNDVSFFVLGANGPIGSTFTRVLGQTGLPTVSLSHRPTANQLSYNFLTDRPEKLDLSSHRRYVFVICSGYSNLDECRQNEHLSHQMNIEATQDVLAYLKNFEVVPLFLSTDYIFDGTKSAYDESDTPHPLNLYGQQKVAIEDFIRKHFERHLIFRSSKIFGFAKNIWVIQQLQMMLAGKQVTCFTDRHFAPVFVDDIPNFALKALRHESFGTFHLAQDEVTTPFQQMHLLSQILSLPEKLVVGSLLRKTSLLEPRPANTFLINKKARETCDFEFTSFSKFVNYLPEMHSSMFNLAES